MKIAFCGKGGSGKSTLSAGFTAFARSHFRNVIAFDADINRHLGVKLDVDATHPDTGGYFNEIFKIVEGNNPFFSSLESYPELGTIPVTHLSHEIKLDSSDPIIKKFATVVDNLYLVRGGTYEEEDFGTSCIHVKLKALELIVHRLHLEQDEIAIFDVTAGTDPLSTSLSFAFDLHVLVVEPTRRSVSVYEDYSSMLGELADRLVVVVNKVRSEEDLHFVHNSIPPEKIVGVIPWSRSLRQAEQGDRTEFAEYVAQNESIWIGCRERLANRPNARAFELAELNRLYKEACIKWASNFYNKDLLGALTLSSQLESQVSA